MSREAVYAKVTAAILAKLEEGVAPWHKPWSGPTSPANLMSRRPYSGINALALGMVGRSPWWLTFNQIRRQGWHLQAGAKGSAILFATTSTVREAVVDARGRVAIPEVTKTVVKCYHVFNALDVEGIPEERITVGTRTWKPIERAEEVLLAVRPTPTIQHEGAHAFFEAKRDAITMPPRASFPNPDAYYSTLFHELTHWTGHPSRLNRASMAQAARFGDKSYSFEELIAEMGAGFLCSLTGLENETLDRSASYIQSWLNVLKESPALIVKAASQAQKAADLIAPPVLPAAAAEHSETQAAN